MYTIEIGGEVKFEGHAPEVALWLAKWSGPPSLWADVYRIESGRSPVLVYAGVTLTRGHREATCDTGAFNDETFRAALLRSMN